MSIKIDFLTFSIDLRAGQLETGHETVAEIRAIAKGGDGEVGVCDRRCDGVRAVLDALLVVVEVGYACAGVEQRVRHVIVDRHFPHHSHWNNDADEVQDYILF